MENNSLQKTLSGGDYDSGKYTDMYTAVEQNFKGVQFSYKGPFSKMSLSLINQFIESFSIGEPGFRTNLFKIFVEQAQNIAENSAERKETEEGNVGCGLIAVSESKEFFEITSGNPATDEDAVGVKNRCDIVNSCDYNELRNLRREYIQKSKNDLNNGNIGLIKMALVSRMPITCDITPGANGVSFLVLRIKIKKD